MHFKRVCSRNITWNIVISYKFTDLQLKILKISKVHENVMTNNVSNLGSIGIPPIQDFSHMIPPAEIPIIMDRFDWLNIVGGAWFDQSGEAGGKGQGDQPTSRKCHRKKSYYSRLCVYRGIVWYHFQYGLWEC